MSRTPWHERLWVLAATILALPSMVLGMVGLNIVVLAVLLVLWVVWPFLAAVVYSLMWVNLVAYRLFYGREMRRSFPATVNHQNGASAWLIGVGVLGAVRSWFGHDSVSVALGVVGAVVLLLSQSTLFRPSSMP